MVSQFTFTHKGELYGIDRKAQYIVLSDGTLLKVVSNFEKVEEKVEKEIEEEGLFDSCSRPFYPSAITGEIDVQEVAHLFPHETAKDIATFNNGIVARKIR